LVKCCLGEQMEYCTLIDNRVLVHFAAAPAARIAK